MSRERWSVTGLGTRVATRTFAMFCLCAALPIALSTVAVDRLVSREAREHAQSRLTQASKSYGLLIFERLQEVDEALDRLAELHLQGNMTLDQLQAVHSPRFRIVAAQAYEGIEPPLQPARVKFSDDVQGPRITLHVSRTHEQRGVAITAVVPGDYLWNRDAVELHDIFLCVGDQAARPIHCPDVAVADEPVLSARWQLFLRPIFGTTSWTITATQPARVALASLERFRHVLPLATLIVIFVASLLSVVQIRRSHRPLLLLANAAERIGRRRFDQRIPVTSRDEYGQLAQVFNRMSASLAQQFALLNWLARIDRLILRDPPIDDLLQKVLPQLPALLHVRRMAIAVDSGLGAELLVYIAAERVTTVERRRIATSGATLQDLLDGRDVSDLALQRSVVETMQSSELLRLPIRVATTLRGVLLLADATEVVGASQLRRARAVARRIAVALGSEERRQALLRQAYYDNLTGLPNRQLFKDRLRQELARAKRADAKLGLIYIDLDRFKHINDSLGHSAGDELLKALSARLALSLRDTDTLARLGGDEFGIIASNPHDPPIHVLAERVHAALRLPVVVRGTTCTVDASLGLTLFPTDADSPETLLRNADIAAYRAKAAGGAQAVYFEESMNAEATRRLAVEQRLRSALTRGELRLAYQPKIRIADGRLAGVESLARWHDPELGHVSPAVFIPIAEECGLIDELGAWAMREACTTYQAWRRAGLDVGHVSVNASMRQLRDARFADEVTRVLEQTGMPPSALEIEVTESSLAASPQQVSALLDQLRALGVRISIDDFGTGYSSMAALGQVPADVLKVDRSFIMDCASRPQAASVVEAIISMAHALGKVTVAEGVETAEQFAVLRGLGCDYVQGYLFARPMNATDLLKYARTMQTVATPSDAPPLTTRATGT